MQSIKIASVFLILAATVHAQAPAQPLPKDVQYSKNSVEFAAIQTEVYRDGWRALQAAAKMQKGNWAVVLDVDQTALDNSEFQEEFGTQTYTDALWDSWVQRADAKAMAGVKEFLDQARALPNGEIVFITDRDDSESAATLKNLREQGLYKDGDLLLTKKDKSDNKGVRRDCVEKAVDPRCKAGGPRPILALFGDSARDFVEFYGNDMETKGRNELITNAGIKYFVLPNPMYGQWENDYQ